MRGKPDNNVPNFRQAAHNIPASESLNKGWLLVNKPLTVRSKSVR